MPRRRQEPQRRFAEALSTFRAQDNPLGLSAAFNAPIPDPKFGVFRM